MPARHSSRRESGSSGLPPAKGGEDLEGPFHVGGHLRGWQAPKVIAVLGEPDMRVGVAGELECRVGSDPGG